MIEDPAYGSGGDGEVDPRNTARIRKRWDAVEKWLRRYAQRSLAHWLGFTGRGGTYLLLATAILTGLTVLSGCQWVLGSFLARLILALIGIAYVIDAALINTSIAFLTGNPINRLRSTLLSLLNLFNIAVVFGLFYELERDCFSDPLTPLGALYFSFVTITTVGFGDIHPKSDCWIGKLTVIAELVVGFYFIAAVFSVVISWAQRPTDGKRND